MGRCVCAEAGASESGLSLCCKNVVCAPVCWENENRNGGGGDRSTALGTGVSWGVEVGLMVCGGGEGWGWW